MPVRYTLKTDEELIDVICEFGEGETEFHTADIERLIEEKRALEIQVGDLNYYIEEVNRKKIDA